MTSTENAATPTDRERETAMRVMAWEPLDYAAFANAVNNGHHPDDRDALETVDAIAQALADQRATIHAQYTAVADEWDQDAAAYEASALHWHNSGEPVNGARCEGVARACRDSAERIRQVGQQ